MALSAPQGNLYYMQLVSQLNFSTVSSLTCFFQSIFSKPWAMLSTAEREIFCINQKISLLIFLQVQRF